MLVQLKVSALAIVLTVTSFLSFEGTNQHSVAHADLGFAKFFSKDNNGAVASFKHAITIDSQLCYLSPWQLWTMMLAGQTQAATKTFKNSLKKDPKDRSLGRRSSAPH